MTLKLKTELNPFIDWFQKQGWTPFEFQLESWQSFLEGKNGLITVPTGSGKTYAAFLGPLAALHKDPSNHLQIIYITPLRSLIYDIEEALKKPIKDLNLPFRVESRTGDTPSSLKVKQNKSLPHILVTTPESLSILLSNKETVKKLQNIKSIIIDEWHELLGNKRGCLLQLALASLRKLSPNLQTWAVSATIENQLEAAKSCLGVDQDPIIITAPIIRQVIIKTYLPESFYNMPWAGQIGLRLLPCLINALDPSKASLIFTNTRTQAEKWFRALIEKKPEWEAITQIHHGSIDFNQRRETEEGIKNGKYKFVFCTSSLDLGVDFPYVEKVFQIGSPKSIARLIQRAGRASHRPLTSSEIGLIPTHALDLAEMSGLKLAVQNKQIEIRTIYIKPFDVLLQHIMTCAIGSGFEAKELFEIIKTAYSFKDLSFEEFTWCVDFLTKGGKALGAYSEFKKIVLEDGKYIVKDRTVAMRHRFNIGTISSNMTMQVRFLKGGGIGQVEEAFIGKLEKEDIFFFSGKFLEFVQVKDNIAYVRLAKNKEAVIPNWQGSRMPFSAPLGKFTRLAIDPDILQTENFEETDYLLQLCQIQQHLSHLPLENELLVEKIKTREGWHIYLYPFEGKLVHEGLAALLTYRLIRKNKGTCSISVNDYGIEILSTKEIDISEDFLQDFFSISNLQQEIEVCVNMNEMAKAPFRDICRIAGLVFSGYPNARKIARQLQMSTTLLFEVFKKYDPENLLLQQAYKEILDKSFEWERLKQTMDRLSKSSIIIKYPNRLTPLALPLFIERISGRLSTESLIERIERIKTSWDK